MDAADEALAMEPKSKDPFDAMPKGTFNFDDFKRSYSNEDEAVSIPYFWSKFDPENYSIWFGEYKYSKTSIKNLFVWQPPQWYAYNESYWSNYGSLYKNNMV